MKENQFESCQKCLLVKFYEWHKKSFPCWFNQKRPGMVCQEDVFTAAKHKITSIKIQNNIVICYIKSHICLKIHTKQKWFLKIIIIIKKTGFKIMDIFLTGHKFTNLLMSFSLWGITMIHAKDKFLNF